MMYNFPFFPQFNPIGNPNYPQNIYYNNKNKINSFKGQNRFHNSNNVNTNLYNVNKKKSFSNHSNSSSSEQKQTCDNNDFFELFGIKLGFDDILLICLIFFLYSEGVKDDFLFIVLILLLLS